MAPENLQIGRDPRGSGYRLSTHVLLPAPRSAVFSFFSDARQLQRITPPWLHFHIQSFSSDPVEAGTLIDYRLRIRGIPVRWRTRISVWEPEERFVDEQLVGPYRWWRHEHRFIARGDSTEMTDTVSYGVPLGWLVHPLLVAPDLHRIFEFRRRAMLELFRASDDSGKQDAT